MRILNRPLRYINREAAAAEGTDIWTAMKAYYKGRENIMLCGERIKAIGKLERDISFIKRLPPYLAVNYILNGIGYEEFAFAGCGEAGEA